MNKMMNNKTPFVSQCTSGQADQVRTTLMYYVLDLKEIEVLDLVQERLQSGDDPLALVEACEAGMRRVGERYEQGEYFLSALIMAGEIFRNVMELVQPAIEERIRGNESGRILLGTVQYDIHDIGKNIQAVLLSCYGVTVLDLGVDVSPHEFLIRALEFHPDIIGLSGLLTSSYDSMRETVAMLRQSGDDSLARVPIVIGGGTLNEQVCQYVGADYWVGNSMDGVRLCQQLLANRQKS